MRKWYRSRTYDWDAHARRFCAAVIAASGFEIPPQAVAVRTLAYLTPRPHLVKRYERVLPDPRLIRTIATLLKQEAGLDA